LRLESKLSRVMEGGFNKSSQRANTKTSLTGSETLVDPDEDQVAMPIPQGTDEEGLHLLYDYTHLGPLDSEAETTDESRPSQTALQQEGSSQDIIVEVESPDEEESPTVQGDITDSPTGRRRTVRFRSRVRIGSGIHSLSASSSTCDSGASSISVPLRGSGHHEANRMSDTNSEPLSAMLPSQATSDWLNELSAARRGKRSDSRTSAQSSLSDERTPLNSSRRRMYTEPQPAGEGDEEELDRLSGAARKTEEEVMFGKWPWRLLSLHVSSVSYS